MEQLPEMTITDLVTGETSPVRLMTWEEGLAEMNRIFAETEARGAKKSRAIHFNWYCSSESFEDIWTCYVAGRTFDKVYWEPSDKLWFSDTFTGLSRPSLTEMKVAVQAQYQAEAR